MKNGGHGGNEAAEIPASVLLRARALACWANKLGMTGTQRDIHLYVASILATCDQCYISVSELARRIGKTRQGCMKAIADGGRFFEHDGYVRDSVERRLWRLVTRMPTMDELEAFMPPRRRSTGALNAPRSANKSVSPPTTALSRPPDNRFAQSVNSPSVRYGEKNQCVGVGGGRGHHHQPPNVSQRSDEGGTRKGRKADPKPGSREYPRYAANKILSVFQGVARLEADLAVESEGISIGSDQWHELFPPDGSATYKPSTIDVDTYLIPLYESCVACRVDFLRHAALYMRAWIREQIELAVGSRIPLRDCLKMSAYCKYLAPEDWTDAMFAKEAEDLARLSTMPEEARKVR